MGLLAGIVVLSAAEQATSRSSQRQATGNSDVQDLAILIHNRIVGVPAQGETLVKMVELLQSGKAREAAMLATEHPFFYDYKLRALFTPWSNREGNVGNPLNDMVTTMIGMVRDDVPFNQVLSGDIFYNASAHAMLPDLRNIKNEEELIEAARGVIPTSQTSSSLKDKLQQGKQSQQLHKTPAVQGAISGVLSTNGFGAAFYSAGTNRRATASVLKNFLCHDIEHLHDTSTPKNWVRQDVDRSPGGDSDLFYRRCVGCHAGMDALSGWNVYYDHIGVLRYTEGVVQQKIKRNVLVEAGEQARDYNQINSDEFTNLWTEGKNASLGWRGKTSGRGAKEFGEMMTRSKAFSSCMASHVYKAVCYLDPKEGAAKTRREKLAQKFEESDYNMRELFADTAVSCLTKQNNNSAGSGEAQ